MSAFVQNNPTGTVDRSGLDIYIVGDPWWRSPWHRAVIGDDGSGGYYYTDFGPTGSGWSLWRDGEVGFNPKWLHPPNKLPTGFNLKCQFKTSPDTDKKLKRMAEDLSRSPARPYCTFFYHC